MADCVDEMNSANADQSQTVQSCECASDAGIPQAFLSSLNFSIDQDRVFFKEPYKCSYNF